MNPAPPPGPKFSDWAFLTISLVLVGMGIFVAIARDPRDALMPLVFFGVCAAVFGLTIYRKLRRRRFTATAASVAGGVKFRASNWRMLGLAAVLALIGGVIFITHDAPMLLLICGGVTLGASLLLVLLVVTGRFARRYLRFDPLGLTVGEASYEFVVPWDEIADIGEFELHDNAVVGFVVRDPDAILVTPASAAPALHRRLAQNLGFSGCHVVIMTAQFGMRAELLCAALNHYTRDPQARDGLVARPALPAAE